MKRAARPAILLALLSTAACASRADTAAFASTSAATHAHELPATAGPGFTTADVQFMQGMISHHAQAILMAGMAPSRGAGDRLLRLAQKIDISQRDEIKFMGRWLAERRQAAPDSMQVHTMMMPGMLSPEQLAQLEASQGPEFERLFLTYMIQHHEGALTMVDDLLASPGAAQDSDIFRFVTDVEADQSAEIDVMWGMLEAIPGSNTK